MVYYFIVGCFLFGFGKSVSDITINLIQWRNSWFSRFAEGSFFGSLETTAHRKEHPNKIVSILKHTILVPFVDVWHFGAFLQALGVGGLMVSSFLSSQSEFIVILAIHWPCHRSVFHCFYHWVLRK